MPELLKNELMINELNELEKQIHLFKQKKEEEIEAYLIYKSEFERLEEENSILKSKIKDLEKKISDMKEDIKTKINSESINIEDRQNFKQRIDDLIEKIDYHLGS